MQHHGLVVPVLPGLDGPRSGIMNFGSQKGGTGPCNPPGGYRGYEVWDFSPNAGSGNGCTYTI